METGSADPFTELGPLGVEEEFFVCDADGRPTSGTDEMVYGSEPPALLEGHLDHELFKCVIEVQTPTIEDPGEARGTMQAVRDALVDHAADHGFRVAAAGLHPGARWRELEHAEKPRYRDQLDRIQYPQHRNTTAGLHVHVGVDYADKAVWIANELRWYLPVILALSANSPYWNGFDTGLASARAKVFEALPNTGMPTTFTDIGEYLRFERLMIETDSIADRGALWYDVRPHTQHGTVEIRTPDAQRDLDRAHAIVEYAHALVLDLADRYDDGERPFDHRRELLDENKWRAIRYGHDAAFIDRDGDGEVSLGRVIERDADRLDVPGIRDVYEAGSGAARQRSLHEAEGEAALYRSLLL